VVGLPGDEEVVVDAPRAAVLHEVVVVDVADHVVAELPLDHPHDPLAVPDHVVLGQRALGGRERRDLAPPGVLRRSGHEDVDVVPADHGPFPVGEDPPPEADDEVRVLVRVAPDPPVRARHVHVRAVDPVPLEKLGGLRRAGGGERGLGQVDHLVDGYGRVLPHDVVGEPRTGVPVEPEVDRAARVERAPLDHDLRLAGGVNVDAAHLPELGVGDAQAARPLLGGPDRVAVPDDRARLLGRALHVERIAGRKHEVGLEGEGLPRPDDPFVQRGRQEEREDHLL
jgi:hypothetical protein